MCLVPLLFNFPCFVYILAQPSFVLGCIVHLTVNPPVVPELVFQVISGFPGFSFRVFLDLDFVILQTYGISIKYSLSVWLIFSVSCS